MGSANLIPIPNPNDSKGIVRAIQKLASLRLNSDSTPTFADLTISGAIIAGYIDFDLAPTVSTQEGRMYWNANDGTVNVGMPGGNVNLQVGQEILIRCRNTTGSLIGNGKAVRINGASGNRPLIELADADDVSSGVTGLATEDIDDNSNGYVTIKGMVRDINTNAYAPGTFLFMSSTAGEITNVPPTGNKRAAFVGTVIIQGSSNGSVLLQPQNSPFLNGLSGVDITSIADKDVLQYNSLTSSWSNTGRLDDLWDIANGTFIESIDFLVTENAGTVTGSLEQTGGGELTQRFSDGFFNLDTDPALTVDLTPYVGTDATPKVVYVYILQSDKGTIVASNSGWPAVEHLKVADLIMQSAVTTGAEGVMGNRNHNDHTQSTDGHGHLSHISERLRKEACHWDSGIAMSIKDAAGAELTTGNSSTAIELVTAVGVAYQLHDQTFAATDMYVNADDDVHVTNQPVADGGGFFATHDLVSDIVSIQDGTAIGVNKYFNLVVWGVQNKTGTASHVMVNLPSSQYTVEAQAVEDADGSSIYDIPFAFKGTGFLIGRLTFRLVAGSQWEYVAIEDLRGQGPSITAGVSVSTTDHSILTNLTADDHTLYHTDARAATWLAANHETTYTHTDIALNTTHRSLVNEHIDWTNASQNFKTTGTSHLGGNVGIGNAPFADKSLFVYQPALDTAVSYAGIHNVHVKSAGASDYADDMYSFQNSWTYNQSGGEIGSLYGVHNTLIHNDGDIGSVANNRHLYGFFSRNDLNAGTVNGSVYGMRFEVDQEAAHTITGNVFGLYVFGDLDGTVTGDATLLRLVDNTGFDYCIYQTGNSLNHLKGGLEITSGSLTVGTTDLANPGFPLYFFHATTNALALFESGDAAATIYLKDDTTTGISSVGIGCLGDDLRFHASSGGTVRMRLSGTGGLHLKEIAAADANVAAFGQLWIKNTDPCELWFTDDAGTDTKIA